MNNFDSRIVFKKKNRTPEQHRAINMAAMDWSGGTDWDYSRLEKAGLSKDEIHKFNTIWKNYHPKGY